jgi:hypothetical protein
VIGPPLRPADLRLAPTPNMHESAMNAQLTEVAERCLAGSESNSMTFPEIVGTLMQGGFESYAIDFRRATAIYYLTDGESID